MAKRDNLRGLLRDEGDDQPLVRGRGVAGMFADNPTSQQADLSASHHDDLSASQQTDKPTKYIPAPFRLPAPLVKAMRVLAAQEDRSQQDLWEEAGRDFLARYGVTVD